MAIIFSLLLVEKFSEQKSAAYLSMPIEMGPVDFQTFLAEKYAALIHIAAVLRVEIPRQTYDIVLY